MRRISLFVLFFPVAFSSQAQHENNKAGKITGRIIDSLSSQPVEYATISLFAQSENKVVNGTMSGSKGVFTLTDVSEGNYKMLIEFIGYKKGEKNNIIVRKENQNIILGNIKLSCKQRI